MSVRPRTLLLTRREILATLGKTTLAFPVLTAVVGSGCGSAPNQPHTPSTITDDQFLDNLEKASFLFFWEQTSVATGLVKDRAFAAGKDSRPLSSIAATGFGLSALCIANQRGYADSSQIQARVLATLNFLHCGSHCRARLFYLAGPGQQSKHGLARRARRSAGSGHK